MTNTEIVFRYLARKGASLCAGISIGTGLDVGAVRNALENLLMAGMVGREGKAWKAVEGKTWASAPRLPGSKRLRRQRDVDAPRASSTLKRGGWDFGPLWEIMRGRLLT